MRCRTLSASESVRRFFLSAVWTKIVGCILGIVGKQENHEEDFSAYRRAHAA